MRKLEVLKIIDRMSGASNIRLRQALLKKKKKNKKTTVLFVRRKVTYFLKDE